ncbi:MAG: Gfo/Idh/MocA family oxidoreductase [Clostridiales bacterium]|nr:Gfo/Idh/MocA family oxidoreductase [Clostridiales bacterium]
MQKIVIVGAGQRCYYNFAENLCKGYKDKYALVGVCDSNVKRCEFYRDTLNPDLKIYTDFDVMMDELKPDAVVVTTPDGFHHDYIIRSLKRGCDVFTEKPMTIDEEKCLAIRRAEKETGKKVIVTFNCRFMPAFVQLKKLISSGVIGKPLSIHYEYVLNTKHGGDYFKRWHRFMDISGGMLVHKSTHHFDIINWILDDEPVSVSAQGALLYYGNESRPHGERCSTCPHQKTCESYEFICDSDLLQKMYFDAEDVDGYLRDHCAFKGDTDIYDSMSVSVAYKKGTLLTYSLNLFNTDEGYTINVIGEKGRLETSTFFDEKMDKFIIRYRDGRVDEIKTPRASGGHGGGDDRMMAMLFGAITDDPLNQCASSFDGAKSAMIGIAANQSIKEGIRVNLTPILDKMR